MSFYRRPFLLKLLEDQICRDFYLAQGLCFWIVPILTQINSLLGQIERPEIHNYQWQ